MNNKAKPRKSTKSTIVGKAKVMSYEDIVKAREERAAKEAATAGMKTWSEARECCARGRCARAKGQSGADERSVRASGGPSGANERAREGPSDADERSTAVAEDENHCSVLQFGSVS